MREIIRPMQRTDIARVYEVECSCFRSPWSKMAFVGELRNDVAHYFVLEINGIVEGYAGMWVLFDEAHITNIAVMKAWRGRGCATRLLYKMMEVALLLGAKLMTLEVRKSNLAAQRLYSLLGFFQNGCRPRYYADSNEDALILWNTDMQKTLDNRRKRL